MDIEVKQMSPTAVEMLDQLSAVCKRFGVDYYAAPRISVICWTACPAGIPTEKAHEQAEAFRSAAVLGLKRSDRSNDMPA